MANPIRLEKFDNKPRQVRGRNNIPQRNQSIHGEFLRSQLNQTVQAFQETLRSRPQNLPEVPEGIQLLIDGATSSKGTPLLDSSKLRGLKLEVLEERPEGSIVALSLDPELQRLGQAIEDFRTDARTEPTPNRPEGTRKAGVNTVFAIDDFQPTPRTLRIGDELSEVDIQPMQRYPVDVEIAAGSELEEEGAQRRQQFSEYLRQGGADIVGNGPIIEEDYALFRAYVSGVLLEDMLNVHVWVKFVELPPQVEQEGMELRNIEEPELPSIVSPPERAATICAIDSGIVTQHPLVEPAVSRKTHISFIPGITSIGDTGTEGHATAVSSIAAFGSLRTILTRVITEPIQPVPVAIARVLDDQAKLPPSVNLKTVLPRIVQAMKEASNVLIYNHSIASKAQFNLQRMSVWAETLDRVSYDNGGEGCLFILCTGNVDGIRPVWHRTEQEAQDPGHPKYLLAEEYRLRNPAQAINALTVGAYCPNSLSSFARRSAGHRPVAPENYPSPFTRTGFGYLGEVKPEVVEEGGNWYFDSRDRLLTRWDVTDVAIAAHDYATTGKLVKFGSATSWAAPKVAHFAARIQDYFQTQNPDLIRAVIVNSAFWPSRFGAVEDQLRLLGYGVPDPERAFNIGGSRCVIHIQDEITIGNAHFYRIPWPSELFEESPDLTVRVSVTLAYRAPIRKSNRKYRGTALEWKFSKRGEPFEDFYNRSVYQGMAINAEEEESEEEEEPSTIADWSWTVKTNLRKRGTVQKDWFEAPASYFGEVLYLSVLGKRGWLPKSQQETGFNQRYVVVMSIEAIGQNIPIHERIIELLKVPVPPERPRIRGQS